MKSPTLYLFVTSLVLLVISNQALGLTTVWIDPTTGNDATGQCNIQTSPFKTIDGSLQACHTTPGDITINLAPQNYPSAGNQQLPLTAGGVITVQAVGGTATIQLTTYFASAGLPTNLILANIVFLGGSSTNYGGVLSLTDGAYVIATNVVFNGAVSSIGGGAVFISGSIGSTFTNCQFINCKTTGTNHYGGAVALFNATAAFTSTSFNECSSQRGGAVYIENEESLQASSPTVTFSSCTFTNNVVDATNAGRDSVLGGGAVNVFAFTQSKSTDPPPVVFRNCTFTSNAATASQGGAVYLGDYTGASIIDTSFSQNSAFMGGAIYGSNAVILDISGSLFSNNNATHVDGDTSGKGGSIYLKTSSINVLSSEFSYNYAAESGGAVQIVGGKSHVESNGADYSNFTNCRFLYNTAFFTGGALQAEYLTGSVYIQSSNFVSNVVQGAGSFVNGQGTGGGAIFASAVYLEIGLDSSVTLFEKNYATMGMGGAIYSLIPEGLVISPSNPRVPAIYSAVFDQNIASTGGAICIDGVGSNLGGYAFIGTRFSNNEATGSNAALPGYGGAMMSFNTTFALSSCSIFNNQAAAQGGGLWAGGEVPSFPTIINTTFANNAAPNNATLSSGAAFVGNTHAYFINTHMNAPEQTPTQVDLYVGERAIVQIAANPYSEHNVDPNTPCQFFGFLVTDNAYLVFNCTPTVSLVYLEKSGNVSINQATRMIISSQLNWLGGGFACNAEGGIVHYVNNNNDPKETAHLQNNDPKFLQKCNFASTGSLYFSHDPSGVAIDLELTEDAQIINYGTARTMGEPVLHSLSNSFFENQGHLIIERTFSLTGPSFGFSSPPPDTLLFISLFNPDSSFNISGSEIAPSSASDVTPYTAFSLTGNFAPNGLLQVNFPDLYKGLSWPSLITYQSHSSKFSVHRGAVPNNKGVLVGLRLKPQYASTSLSFSISSTATLLSGNQVFGIIFGVLLIVSLIGFGVYFWYRNKSGVVEYHGQVYETIDKPVYGSA